MYIFVASKPCTNKLPRTSEVLLDTIFITKETNINIFPGVGDTDIETSNHHGNIRPYK